MSTKFLRPVTRATILQTFDLRRTQLPRGLRFFVFCNAEGNVFWNKTRLVHESELSNPFVQYTIIPKPAVAPVEPKETFMDRLKVSFSAMAKH